MAFNAGAFAGALGQSALSTYERLNEAGFRNLQKQQLIQDMQDKAALKEAISTASQEKKWSGGQDVSQAINQATAGYDPETAAVVQGIVANQTPEQQQATLRAYGGAEGMATPKTQEGALDLAKVGVYQSPEGKTMASNQGEALSRAEIYKGALRKAEETGNVYAIDKLTQMKTQARQSENEDKWDDLVNKNLFKVNNFAATGNTEDFIKYAKSHGLDARVRKTNDGGQVIEHWENGRLKQSFGSLQAAVNAAQGPLLSYLVETEGLKLMGTPEKAYAALQQRRANDLKAEANAIDREYKGAGGVIDRAYASGAKGGAKETIKGKAAEYADALIEGKVINPKTNKPYTPEEAKVQAYDVILKNPNVKERSDWDYSSDKSVRSNKEGVVQDWNGKQWSTRGLPAVSAAAADKGVIADVDKSGRAAFRGANDKWYSTEQDAYNSFSQKPAAAGSTSAIPTGRSKREFNVMVSNAKRNNPQARLYLQNLIDENELTLSERQEALTALGR